MNRWLIILSLAVALVVSACGKNPATPINTTTDDTTINQLLIDSKYADTTSFTNDNTADPYSKDFLEAKTDTFPFAVKFARRVNSVSRTVTITYDSSNAVARAHIRLDIYGNFYVDNDGDTLRDPFVRAFHDQGDRYVRLRKVLNVWRIWGVTPLVIATANAATNVIIDKVEVSGCINGPIEILPEEMSAARLRENLPIFNPGATAQGKVWAHTSGTDSAWAFLHRWIYRFPRHHIRWPFYRESVNYFTRSWAIAADSIDNIVARPAIRHASVDVISWAALFGDSTAQYSARAWCLPYIVTSDTTLPE